MLAIESWRTLYVFQRITSRFMCSKRVNICDRVNILHFTAGTGRVGPERLVPHQHYYMGTEANGTGRTGLGFGIFLWWRFPYKNFISSGTICNVAQCWVLHVCQTLTNRITYDQLLTLGDTLTRPEEYAFSVDTHLIAIFMRRVEI